MPLLAGRKKPSTKKTFFQNYKDHLNHIEMKYEDKWKEFSKLDANGKPQAIMDEVLAHLTMLDPLRDGYDYLDEVLGATGAVALHFVSYFATIALAAHAAWEGAKALAIKTGISQDDGKDHLTKARNSFLAAVAVYVASVAIIFNFALSLVGRPLVTAIQGYKEQDVERFVDQKTSERNAGIISSVFGLSK